MELHNILTIKKPKTSVDRLSIYVYLECLGYKVPPYGQVDELHREHKKEDKCVVWLYDGGHLMSLDYAYKRYPRSYAAMYVGQKGAVSVSCKYVQIGRKGYFVDMISYDDWRSNKGKCECTVELGTHDQWHPLVKLPFFSVDLIRTDKLYAIDFDVEPGLKGLGLDKIIKPKDFKILYREGQKHYS